MQQPIKPKKQGKPVSFKRPGATGVAKVDSEKRLGKKKLPPKKRSTSEGYMAG